MFILGKKKDVWNALNSFLGYFTPPKNIDKYKRLDPHWSKTCDEILALGWPLLDKTIKQLAADNSSLKNQWEKNKAIWNARKTLTEIIYSHRQSWLHQIFAHSVRSAIAMHSFLTINEINKCYKTVFELNSPPSTAFGKMVNLCNINNATALAENLQEGEVASFLCLANLTKTQLYQLTFADAFLNFLREMQRIEDQNPLYKSAHEDIAAVWLGKALSLILNNPTINELAPDFNGYVLLNDFFPLDDKKTYKIYIMLRRAQANSSLEVNDTKNTTYVQLSSGQDFFDMYRKLASHIKE